MLISPAYAQGIGGSLGGIGGLLPLVLIFVVFYFLLIRPQQRKARSHREMVGAVRRGDSVVTAGGIRGKVTKVVDDDWLQVEIADGVRVVVAKGTISNVVSRGEPVKEPPTRSSGKKRPSGRRPKPEPEEEAEDEEDSSFDDEAGDDEAGDEDTEDEGDAGDEHEEEPEEVKAKPRPAKRGKKKAAS